MVAKKTSPEYKAGYKQGYNDRKDEQLGAKNGKEKSKKIYCYGNSSYSIYF